VLYIAPLGVIFGLGLGLIVEVNTRNPRLTIRAGYGPFDWQWEFDVTNSDLLPANPTGIPDALAFKSLGKPLARRVTVTREDAPLVDETAMDGVVLVVGADSAPNISADFLRPSEAIRIPPCISCHYFAPVVCGL
jgi:hypothetical protein